MTKEALVDSFNGHRALIGTRGAVSRKNHTNGTRGATTVARKNIRTTPTNNKKKKLLKTIPIRNIDQLKLLCRKTTSRS
ncbi:hypothetical protein SESBI_30259 [Sesbania bispinosa]|nr:hypothetical protein SESBI_30259 [Sesbania bispinosa]